MKKALSLLLALALSLSCTACSGDSKTQGGKADNGSTAAASAGKSGEAENGTPQYSVTFLCMTLGDMSFADSGKRGLDMLEEKYGFKTKEPIHRNMSLMLLMFVRASLTLFFLPVNFRRKWRERQKIIPTSDLSFSM